MALQMIRLTKCLTISGLCIKTHLAPLQSAFISGRELRDRRFPRPPPFPYKDKRLSRLRAWLENPVKWFDENTKLIVVEGSIGAGKSDFAKKLAAELEMHHMPEATVDMIYINKYGHDLRKLDSQLPLDVQSFDVKDFYKNPKSRLSNKFQVYMYYSRFEQYIDALAHLFNTGQGVVMERCVYSDIVFMETMAKFNYLAPSVRDYYNILRKNTLPDLLRPHLVIYLDSPVDVLMDRIKKRAIVRFQFENFIYDYINMNYFSPNFNDYETKSSVITPDYLKTLETEYKEYLKTISQHSELLFYDWSKYGDIDIVIEDIERIDFDNYDKYDTKMTDWLLFNYWDYVKLRFDYTTKKNDLLNKMTMIPQWNAPELLPETENIHKWRELWDNFPGSKYEYGYNPDQGDNVWFKIKKMPRED
uniref:NADH dehydrogenase [ubiquinone] 1 alpha subcomplex subunit 10, mitochondrial n=1 Tax=Strigamia maritima TaxID=126957 RepID=T1JDL5_STRMM